MSETATVTVKSVEQNQHGWHELKDGNDVVYSTKKADVIAPARELVGKQALLGFTVKTNEKDGRTYTNRYLDSVEAVSSNGDTPPLGTGEYVTGQKPPIEARRIFASVAANCATKLTEIVISQQTGREITPDVVCATWDAMCSHVFLELARKGEVITDGDIPF